MKLFLPLIVASTIFPQLAPAASLRNGDTNGVDVRSIKIAMPAEVAWWAGIIEDGFKMPLADGYQMDMWGNIIRTKFSRCYFPVRVT
jgi:hypothetical protein